ncbi:MAG: UDP-N-acetylglucosamine 4,6-dehydratase (inverting) [Patescibacteria group bacterium]
MTYEFLDGKSILVTGGTGSFGQRFVRTLLEQTTASRIIVFSRDELKQSQMQSTFAEHLGRLRFFLGDVRDASRLSRAFEGVDFVVHAAALKQVPLLEYNPFEAIQTNIIGTKNVIEAAIDRGVQKVLLISTDKAANPANLYGATKLCAEKLIVSGNSYSSGRTKLSAVRYGNVLGSRGSLLKLVEEQRKTGVVTLTHEEMTRFWITLDQGVALVMRALESMHGGEIFIPKIPSMRVKDLLHTLAPECAMKVIGIRPGEKLHEVLVTPEEARRAKEFDGHFVILPEFVFDEGLAPRYAEGKGFPEGASYGSEANPQWLDEQGLKDLLASL